MSRTGSRAASRKRVFRREASRWISAAAVWALPLAARAEETFAGFWGDTPAAEAYTGVPGAQAGRILLSLLVVAGLLALLAWGVRRSSGRRVSAASRPRCVFRARFNARQILMVVEREGRIECRILDGKRTELETEIPGVVPASGSRRAPAAGTAAPPPRSFREVWGALLRGGRS